MEQLSSLPSLDRNDLPRIGIRQDLLLIPTSAFLFGFVSGLVTSSRLSGRQFLAENAHRLPTTVQGWYFYTKTKNYRVMHGGIKGGLKTGGRLGAWTLAFIGLEEGIEYGMRSVSSTGLEGWRTRSISGGISGLALASAATQIYRLSKQGATRRLFLGASLGIVAGGCHDLRDWTRQKLDQQEDSVTS